MVCNKRFSIAFRFVKMKHTNVTNALNHNEKLVCRLFWVHISWKIAKMLCTITMSCHIMCTRSMPWTKWKLWSSSEKHSFLCVIARIIYGRVRRVLHKNFLNSTIFHLNIIFHAILINKLVTVIFNTSNLNWLPCSSISYFSFPLFFYLPHSSFMMKFHQFFECAILRFRKYSSRTFKK